MVEDANGSMFRHGIFSSYSGAEITPVIDMPGRIDNPIVIGEIHTISYSTHSEIVPVRLLSSRRVAGFSRGPRTVAGTLIFTVFEQDVVRKLAPEYMNGILIDEMPPFNINVVCKNDSGAMSRYAILGVRLVDSGMVMSVDNIITENTISYIAEDMVALHVVRGGGVYAGGLEPSETRAEQAASVGDMEPGDAAREDRAIATDGVTLAPAATAEKPGVLEDDSFYLQVDVSKQLFRQQDDGEVVAISMPAVGHSVRVYEGGHPEWDGANGLPGVGQAKQLLLASTDSGGTVRTVIEAGIDGTMEVVVVAQWGDSWQVERAALKAGEHVGVAIDLPTAATVGGSAEQSWESGVLPPGQPLPSDSESEYVWIRDDSGKNIRAAVARNIPGLVFPRRGYDYAVDVRARCYYLAPGPGGELVQTPVNGPQLSAALYLAISYDMHTGYRVCYPVPIAADGTVATRIDVVGYLRFVNLEYLPVGHYHTIHDYAIDGYYFEKFHVDQFPPPREVFGTRLRPGILDLGDLVFDGVLPRSDIYNAHLCGVATDPSGNGPVGARVAVQMRWGDEKDAKCYTTGTIGSDGFWCVSAVIPVSMANVRRLYVEYLPLPGYTARGPFQVDRNEAMIPPNTSKDKPFNVMGLLRSVCQDDPHIVFLPNWPAEYPDGAPESEECSVPATMVVGGRVVRSDGSLSIPIAKAIVSISFMAAAPGSNVPKSFTRYAVADPETGRFQLMIPPNKQLLRLSAHADGFSPFVEEWAYLEGDPKAYTSEQAEMAEGRRRQLAVLRNGTYDIHLSYS